mmetsp:Transcript_10987/g.20296  ORF Transcript_10987/g.20296 Transcript_10987/m.20296 type:complete len:101 (-) Transcript_10987:2569-2871(-)
MEELEDDPHPWGSYPVDCSCRCGAFDCSSQETGHVSEEQEEQSIAACSIQSLNTFSETKQSNSLNQYLVISGRASLWISHCQIRKKLMNSKFTIVGHTQS